MRSDDLTPLLAPAPGPSVGFRQGVIVTWDQATAENTVRVGSSLLTNLPILNTSEAALLEPGAVVGILTAGRTWGILGRFTIPGTPEAASALSAVRTASDSITDSESSTSATFDDLATYGPEVTLTVGASGRVLVTLSAGLQYEALRGSGLSSAGALMGFEMSGANALIPFTSRALQGYVEYNSAQVPSFDTDIECRIGASRVVLLEGLTPGSTTFTAKYAKFGAAASATFNNRVITVQAI